MLQATMSPCSRHERIIMAIGSRQTSNSEPNNGTPRTRGGVRLDSTFIGDLLQQCEVTLTFRRM
jgi:hypothetical protein